ncbi:MAG: hypothetical protein ACFFEN_12440 [Candidatus Thorarchaeota archaeon]
MVDYQQFMVFDIEDSGDKNKIKIEKVELNYYLHPEKTFIIVREDLRRIYLWKGAKSSVRKRFLGSRVATEIQGELMKNGFHRCKILSVDQGDEVQEFLNVFGLDSMEVTEQLEDKIILRNNEKEKLEREELLDTKMEITETSKLDEITKLLDYDEKMLWIKSSTGQITKKWFNTLIKNKKYKNRIKTIYKMDNIEEEVFQKRNVITNKRIITNDKLNEFFDFSGISEAYFKQEGPLAFLDLKGLASLEIGESKGFYDVWFNALPKKGGEYAFFFESLTIEEYYKLVDIFTLRIPFRAKIPEEVGKLTYVPKSK